MNKNTNIVLFDSAQNSIDCNVVFQTTAIHKILNTETIVSKLNFESQNIQIHNFAEYATISFDFDPENEEEFDTVSTKIKELYDTKKYKHIYNNHWFHISCSISCSVGIKIISLNFPDSFNVRFNFTKNNYSIIISLSLVSAYSEVNGYKKDISAFMTYANLLEFTDKEKSKIAELNKAQYLSTTPQISAKNSSSIKKYPKLFSKKKEEEKESLDDVVLDEKESSIFDMSILNIADGMTNSDLALSQLIGLDNVKEEIEKFKAKLEYRKKQENRGIYCEQNDSMHMCFMGAPGTGKTSVARIVTGILYDLGYIKNNKCVEVNGENLKGGYIGQTAIITKAVLKNARNKVLFIDEAYALFDDFENGYGKEAVAVILKEMEDNRDNMIIIFAGYNEEMQKFLKMNDGLKSRINRYINFQNYSPLEMLEIMMLFLKKRKFYITPDAMEICLNVFKGASFNPNFSNARFVRNLVEKIEEEHIYNVRNIKDVVRRDTIHSVDITDEIIRELLEKSM